MKTRPNEIVHPQIETDPKREGDTWYGQVYSFGGITKREYFAAMCLQGFLANPERYKYIADAVANDGMPQTLASQKNAEKAVYLADALIAALNQEAKDATA